MKYTPSQYALAVKRAKPRDKVYDLPHGDLLLRVAPSGTMSWIARLKKDGKESRVVLGRYRDPNKTGFKPMELKEARDKAEELRVGLRTTGQLPAEVKRAKREAIIKAEAAKTAIDGSTFEAAARRWHASLPEERNSKHLAQCISTLERWVFPNIGAMPIAEIKPTDILDRVLRPMLRHKDKQGNADPLIETATRVFQRIGAVYEYAGIDDVQLADPTTRIARKFRDLKSPLLKSVKPEGHFAAVQVDGDQEELRRLLQAIPQCPSERTRLALQLILLTACRSGELRGATWDEVDVEARLWTIPGRRMKAGEEHAIPISDQAAVCFERLRELAGDSLLVLPSDLDSKKSVSDMTLSMALRRLGFTGQQTVHGFRAIFSTLMREDGRFSRDAIEASLAHAVATSAVEKAYMRGKFLDDRRELMQAYADLLDRIREGERAKVMTKRPKTAKTKDTPLLAEFVPDSSPDPRSPSDVRRPWWYPNEPTEEEWGTIKLALGEAVKATSMLDIVAPEEAKPEPQKLQGAATDKAVVNAIKGVHRAGGQSLKDLTPTEARRLLELEIYMGEPAPLEPIRVNPKRGPKLKKTQYQVARERRAGPLQKLGNKTRRTGMGSTPTESIIELFYKLRVEFPDHKINAEIRKRLTESRLPNSSRSTIDRIIGPLKAAKK